MILVQNIGRFKKAQESEAAAATTIANFGADMDEVVKSVKDMMSHLIRRHNA